MSAQVKLKTEQPEHTAHNLSLEWDNLTIGAWKNLLAKAPRSNLLLSWPVILATFETKRRRPSLGVFYQEGTPVALVVTFHWRFLLWERLYIHRAPIWLTEPTPGMLNEALHKLKDTLTATGRSKLFRQVHFMPELPNTDSHHKALESAGFKSLHKAPYRSLWLDITLPLDALEKNLKKGWLSGLKKSRKHKLTFAQDNTSPGYKLFLRGYKKDKTLKNYRGPSVLFLLNIRKHARRGDIMLLEAWHEGQLVAGQLFVRHGTAATYLVGWTTPEGREVAAHNGLLFEAISRLKEQGVAALDLGGLSEGNPGLNKFKEGLGGTSYELAGEWTL